MNPRADTFSPVPPLVTGPAHDHCRVSVVLPARNEETSLGRCLDAFAAQVDLDGTPLPASFYEVLFLLNNCTDGSVNIAAAWQTAHPNIALHIIERTLSAEEAHVGTARRLLMDTAWSRLRHVSEPSAILSTDADTVVAPDWIAQNLRALAEGADVVGGVVGLVAADLDLLPQFVQQCYARDRRYAGLVAQLEDLLDPQEGDRCPRHLDHFGSSMACTPQAYAAAGGMPAITPLEDEAFIDRIRHASLRLRHDPAVRVFTSARLDGRAVMGLAGQLRLWDGLPDLDCHLVPSAAFLEHRFSMMHRLRQIFRSKDVGDLALPTVWWRNTFAEALRDHLTCPGFLGAVYCNVLITESFGGATQEPIKRAIVGLQARLRPDNAVDRGQISNSAAIAYMPDDALLTSELSGSLQ